MAEINRILFKVNKGMKFTELCTYSRELGRKGRFIVWTKKLSEWMLNPEGSFIDFDCGNYVRIWKTQFGSTGKKLYCIEFTWLSEHYGNVLSGNKQLVKIDAETFDKAMSKNVLTAMLNVDGGIWDGVLEVSADARAEVANLTKRQRRAFTKSMYRLKYPQDYTKLCSDGKHDFFFRCASGMVGGLVLHTERNGGLYYGVHT